METPTTQLVSPRDSIELRIADIWARHLGEEVGVDEDFFELGGDSLVGVRVLTELRSKFHLEADLNLFYSAPTVAAQASVVRGGGQVPPADCLIPLQTGRVGPTLFCFHAASGTVTRFVPLARALGPARTVYGLEARGLDPMRSPHRTMDEMANAYLRQILRIQLEGPYFLLGYSMGGVIAYEVAQRLSRAGHSVGWVGLIDTRSTWTPDALSDEQVLSWLVHHGLGLDVEIGPLLSLDPAHRVERLLDIALETGKLPSDYDRSRLRRMIDIYDINVSALSGYELQPYEGHITLFRASDCTDPREDLGWRRLARRLAICRVPGDHFSMILPGNVEVMARHTGAVLSGKP